MANLPGKAWLDEDGRHVWCEHLCSAEKGTVRCMLPWPHWQALNGAMSPSVVCEVPGCGHHSIPLILEPPADWEPRKERPGMPANVEFSGTPAASSPEAPLERRVGTGAQEEKT